MSDPKIDKLKGKAKEAVGKLIGDDKLKRKGQAERASAEVRETIAEVREKIGHVMENAIDRAGATAGSIKGKFNEVIDKVGDNLKGKT